jgi:hypothetical protein
MVIKLFENDQEKIQEKIQQEDDRFSVTLVTENFNEEISQEILSFYKRFFLEIRQSDGGGNNKLIT